MGLLTRFFGLLILLTMVGCGKNPGSSSMDMVSKEMAAPTTEQRTDESTEQIADKSSERKLIKEGRVEFETTNLNSTRKSIFDAVDRYKGYVSSDQEYKSPGRVTNTVIIRVPADNFDNFLKAATEGIDRFDSKEINVKDVTEEYLDIAARLKTKKELEARYLDLLKQAKNVSEILQIEKEVGQLRSEIESIEGRLKYLQSQVSFSTLTMTFYESLPNETAFGQKFKNGFRNGWDNLIWFFVGLTNIWPFILMAIALFVGVSIYRKRK